MKKRLELYIHIPFCVKKCNYCDFLSFASDEQTQVEYTKSLVKEIEFYGERLGNYSVSTIFIGGGTPSWLSEQLLSDIMLTVYDCFDVEENAEITIECNPGTVTRSKLEKYKQLRINRLSIGLQSTEDEELRHLGRIHTYDNFLKTYEMARTAGFYNISVDLISCLPYQTADRFAQTLNKVVRLKPEHISVYTLMIEKGTPFYDMYKFDAVKQEAGIATEILPDEDEAFRIYKATTIVLQAAGYNQYEISNYCKPGFECQHNIGYWTRENYLGLGLGASSLVDNVRYSNTVDLFDYCSQVEDIKLLERPEGIKTEWHGTNLHASAEPVSRKAQMEEFMFLGLRMNRGVSRFDFEKYFGISIDAIYRGVIDELKSQELLVVKNGQIFLSEKGMDLSNYAMSRFLLT